MSTWSNSTFLSRLVIIFQSPVSGSNPPPANSYHNAFHLSRKTTKPKIFSRSIGGNIFADAAPLRQQISHSREASLQSLIKLVENNSPCAPAGHCGGKIP